MSKFLDKLVEKIKKYQPFFDRFAANKYISGMRNGLILAILVMSFVPMLAGINIGWYAHLFGFGIGYLYAYLSYGVRRRE